jgi:GT2 family glycosyltransferase
MYFRTPDYSMNHRPELTIVILNWNGLSLLEQFLPAVVASAQNYGPATVLLVDNASTDTSLAWTREHCPTVRLLALDQNYGFAEGNNRALPHIRTPFFILLNSDVEVEATADWLTALVLPAVKDTTVAVVQPKIRSQRKRAYFEYAGAAGGWIDSLGYPFCRGRIFETVEKDTQQYDTETEIFWASGACMLIRTAVATELGLFDSHFFAHQEEIDFCWRVKNAGYKIWYTPDATVFHVGGATLDYQHPRKVFLNFRNNLCMMLKNLAPEEVFYRIFMRLILDAVAALRELIKGRPQMVWQIFRSHIAFYTLISHCRRQRIGKKFIPLKKHTGVFKGIIIWKYFLGGVKTFDKLLINQNK